MDKQLTDFKARVKSEAENPAFIHHKWFVKYHLELVERVALELLECYPEADRELVLAMVWLHDYGKALDFDNQYEMTQKAGRKAMQECGYPDAFAERAAEYIGILDKKMELDLHEAPIEVQIVSSADAASHHVGPFMHLHWYENPALPVEELLGREQRKTMKDWDRKMVLPEVRAAFEVRHRLVLENAGAFPEKFLLP